MKKLNKKNLNNKFSSYQQFVGCACSTTCYCSAEREMYHIGGSNLSLYGATDLEHLPW